MENNKNTPVEEVKEETTEVKDEVVSENVESSKKVEESNADDVVDNKTTEAKDEKKSFFKKKEDSEKKKLQEENALLKDKYLRVNAEMQNMRRRMEEEKTNLLKYEGEDLIKRLLPVIDNFERAITMDDTNLEDELSKFLSGFKMIYGNLNSTLQSYEVVAMDILNKPFDPNTMEAVMVEEVPDMESNIVVDVLQKGYTYKGKVIRHAMVKVSK
ncbi:MAG: nucleotide exchange factor GrpE [Candidatus Coprovivens sp.]